MPVLPSKNHETKRIYLPSTTALPEDDKAWVELAVGGVGTDEIILLDNKDLNSDIRAGFKLLLGRIRNWNFTEADGSQVPVSSETLSRIDPEDFSHLVDIVRNDVEKADTDGLKATTESSSLSS